MKAQRNSNIELLRILSMIAIVMGHLITQGGGIEKLSTQVFSIYIGSASRIAVNVFLFIGVYFMVDSDFKGTRVLDLWGQLFVYTSFFTVLAMLLDSSIPMKELIKGVLPFSTRALWFASAYLILVVWHPYLKCVFLIERKKLLFLVITLTYVFSVMPSFSAKQNDFIVNIAWFVYSYILIGFLKKHTCLFDERKYGVQKYGIAIGLLIYLGLTSCHVISLMFDNKYIAILCSLSDQYLSDIKSIPNALCALSIFCDFVSMRAHEYAPINKLAKSTFAIYVIHQTPAFFPVLWSKIIHTDLWFSSSIPVFGAGVAISIILIFSFCCAVDGLRRKYIEPFYKNLNIYRKIITSYDAIINSKT